MPRPRRRIVVVAGVVGIAISAIAVVAEAAYEATWASPDRVVDGLDLPHLGVVSHREHNDFFSIDISPNTTVELEPRAGKSVADLLTAVTDRMEALGYTSGPYKQAADYVQWQHGPSTDPRFGTHDTLVIVTVPRTGTRVGSDTNGLHWITVPTIRFEASSD